MPPTWLLPYPLGHTGLILNNLSNELGGEVPHRRKFADGVVTLGEGLGDFSFMDIHRRLRGDAAFKDVERLVLLKPYVVRDSERVRLRCTPCMAMIKEQSGSIDGTQVVVILNWADGLRERSR